MNPNDIQISLAYSSWIKDKPIIKARHVPTGLEYTATGRSAHRARALALEGLEQLFNEIKPQMNTTMNVEEFFKLSVEEREQLANLHYKQSQVRQETEQIKQARQKLDAREANIQMECKHPLMNKTHRKQEHYDGNAFHTDFYCPDCGIRYSEDGSK